MGPEDFLETYELPAGEEQPVDDWGEPACPDPDQEGDLS